MNILFVCSMNQWRSATAETIFKDVPLHHVKSAGTEPGARVRVNEDHIHWAEIIFVMEKKHRDRLYEKFSEASRSKKIVILDIPDNYTYMHPELIEILKVAVAPYL